MSNKPLVEGVTSGPPRLRLIQLKCSLPLRRRPGETIMQLNASLVHNNICFNTNFDTHLVVTLKAPKLEWEKNRPAVKVIACVDVSGSMAGQKIDFVKKSLVKLVDQL